MIFSGFTNFPSIIIPKVSQRPLSPTSLQLQAAVQHGRSAHSPRAGASCAEKDKKKVRTGSPDRVFVMKNRTFVEFISKIRAACLFLHIANKNSYPCA